MYKTLVLACSIGRHEKGVFEHKNLRPDPALI